MAFRAVAFKGSGCKGFRLQGLGISLRLAEANIGSKDMRKSGYMCQYMQVELRDGQVRAALPFKL